MDREIATHVSNRPRRRFYGDMGQLPPIKERDHTSDENTKKDKTHGLVSDKIWRRAERDL